MAYSLCGTHEILHGTAYCYRCGFVRVNGMIKGPGMGIWVLTGTNPRL